MCYNCHALPVIYKDKSVIKELQSYAQKLRDFKPIEVAAFPDIELYMDQALTCLDKFLGQTISGTDEEINVTANMINNYVKDSVIPRPVNKRYSRDQLLRLYLVLQMKPVMPLSVIACGLRVSGEEDSIERAYTQFSLRQKESFGKIAERLLNWCESFDGDEREVRQLAFQLTAEANALRIAGEKLLAVSSATSPEIVEAKT